MTIENMEAENTKKVLDVLVPMIKSSIDSEHAIKVYAQLSKLDENILNDNLKSLKNELLKKATKQLKTYGTYDHYNLLYFMKKIKGTPHESEIKKNVLLEVLKDYKKISSYERKAFYNKICQVIETENQRIDLLNAFHDYIPTKEVKAQLKNISNGIDNNKLTFGNKLKYKLLNYTPSKFKDQKTRLEVVKMLIAQPNATQYLTTALRMSRKDIESLPPVSRLAFLEWYYSDHIKVATGKNFNSKSNMKAKIQASRKYYNKNKIKLNQDLTSDEMSKMLFATAIKKNDRVTKFINNFKEYERMLSGNIIFVKVNSY